MGEMWAFFSRKVSAQFILGSSRPVRGSVFLVCTIPVFEVPCQNCSQLKISPLLCDLNVWCVCVCVCVCACVCVSF